MRRRRRAMSRRRKDAVGRRFRKSRDAVPIELALAFRCAVVDGRRAKTEAASGSGHCAFSLEVRDLVSQTASRLPWRYGNGLRMRVISSPLLLEKCNAILQSHGRHVVS